MPRKPAAREVKKPERPKRLLPPKEKKKAVAAVPKKVVKKAPKKAKKNVAAGAKKDGKKNHPTYESMIRRAIRANEGRLTSLAAIASFITNTFTVPEAFRRFLRNALKRLEENKTLIKVRASYKLSKAKKKRSSRSKSPAKKRGAEKEVNAKPEKKQRKRKVAEGKEEEEEEVVEEEEAAKAPKKKRAPSKKKVVEAEKPEDPSGYKYDHFWQYDDHGWKNYDPTASDVVEEVYQNYLSNRGDTDVRAVKSGHWEYMVDFLAMKQTNIQHESHTVRNIRRAPLKGK